MKSILKRGLARLGYYLGRFPRTYTLDQHLAHVLSALDVNCVLDVGAHHGGYGRRIRALGFAGHIISFEPVPQNFAVLSAQSAGDSTWRACEFALGDRDGTAAINIYRGSTFHSFLPASAYGQQRFGERMAVERTEDVRIRRLDAVLDECIAGIANPRIFLKMDTQGYDLAVLAGAGARIDQIVALQAELAVREIYDGMTTGIASAMTDLQKRGFDPTGMFPVTWDDDGVRVIEFDCVMCR